LPQGFETRTLLGWSGSIQTCSEGFRLQVGVGDADAAIEVLNQPIPEVIPFDEKEEFVQPQCPRCGSIDISFLGTDRGAALASVTLLALPLPTGGESWTCALCGARWRDDAPEATEPEQ
jgi:hypothetical protein